MPKKEELKKKEVIRIAESLKQNYTDQFTDFIASQRLFRGNLTLKKTPVILYYTKDKIPLLFEYEQKIIPTLHSLRKYPNLLPTITVDAGAVSFMIKGADLFRPGIVSFEEFSKGQFVTVVNEKQAAMCIGIALYNSFDLPDKGKVTKTVHHLNDVLWNYQLS
jgi:PUA domain protein